MRCNGFISSAGMKTVLGWVGWMAASAALQAYATPAITGLEWRRDTVHSGLIAMLELSEPCSPERIRILVDVDGPAKGEARLGGDYMVEGPHLYQHDGKGDWSWKQIGPAPVIISSNRMSVRLPPLSGASELRAMAEITGEDWSTLSRFPEADAMTIIPAALSEVDWLEISGADVDPSMQLREVSPFRTTAGGIGFLVTVAGSPDVSRLRLMIDTNGTATGWSEFGIDLMTEGAGFYRYPAGETEWRWDGVDSVLSSANNNTLAVVIPGIEIGRAFRWYAESFNPQWEVVRRYPAKGIVTQEVATLAVAPEFVEPPPVNLADLMTFMPETLSRRMAGEYLEKSWRPQDRPAPLPQLVVPGFSSTADVFIEYTDARTGARKSLVPERVDAAEDLVKWSGRIDDDTTWFVIQSPGDDGEVDIVGAVESSVEQCFRITIGISYPDAAWYWYDDMAFNVEMDGRKTYIHDYASPYGLTQRRSYYPFGVIASTSSVLVAEADAREPRQFQIDARSSERKLSVHFDMATTSQTGHFPGRAAFHARFQALPREAADPFRKQLQDWYGRDPDWYEARTRKHGLWLPFTDIRTIAGAEDFHFAFFEKVGSLGGDVDAAHDMGVLNFPYIEPWLYWLPMNDPSTWNHDAAVQRMQQLGASGFGKERDFASAGFLGASRDAELKRRITFLNTPWSNGGRMEVNTDPELPVTPEFPVNRAMAEWRYIQSVIDDPRVDGIYLDSMSAMETIDYNPEAMKVADYPATFVLADLKPGLAMPVQAVEFTAALGRYLRARGKDLMANFPCWKYPFFMPYIDVPGEETSWYSGQQFTPLSARELNYRRAISGAKPFGFLQATHFDVLTRSDMEKYFRECLYFAFMPSFFSHDGANDPYWVDSEMYERDRPLFRKYLPLTIRLSEAGWRPVPSVAVRDSRLRVEQYGSANDDVFFITVRNPLDGEADDLLVLDTAAGERIVYDMMSGRLSRADDDGRDVAVSLSPAGITCLAFVRPERVEAEAARNTQWNSNNIIYEAASRNLMSLAKERVLGLRCSLEQSAPVVGDDPVRMRLSVDNHGEQAVSLLIMSGESTSRDIAPGEHVVIELPEISSRRQDGWILVRWSVDHPDGRQVLERLMSPRTIEPFRVTTPASRMQADGGSATLDYVVTGRGVQTSLVTLAWSIDNERGELVQPVSYDQPGHFRLNCGQGEQAYRKVDAVFSVNDQVIHQSSTYVVFAPVLQHKGMAPEVRITSDSAYSGYTTEALRDGVVETAGLNWNEGAFASAETTDKHWIKYEFKSAVTLSALIAHWNREGGVTYASRCGEVWVTTTDGGRLKVGGFTNEVAAADTTVSFSPVDVIAIELIQPLSCGSAERPGLLWMSELEIK